jgi:hypothetical protein
MHQALPVIFALSMIHELQAPRRFLSSSMGSNITRAIGGATEKIHSPGMKESEYHCKPKQHV